MNQLANKSSFRIFIKVANQSKRFYKFELNKNGFYIVDYSERGDHFSYHTDGNCFYHFLGKRQIKRIRTPLNLFTGIETLRSLHIIIYKSWLGKSKNYKFEKDDILIDRDIPFDMEILISNKKRLLPRLPQRFNSKRYYRKLDNLWVIIEVYNGSDTQISDMRYTPTKWVTGQNTFSLIDGRWQ